MVVVQEKIEYLPLDKVEAASQVRKDFDEDSLRGLADSLLSIGQQQPIRVRRDGDVFVVVNGERRLRATRMTGVSTTIAAIVETHELDSVAVQQRQIIDNCQRDDLTPMEKSQAVKELMTQTGWTAAEAAAKLGFSRGTLSKLLALADLPESIQTQIREGIIPATAGYELARVTDAGQQAELAAKVATGELTRDGLSGIVKRRQSAQSTAKSERSKRVRVDLGGSRSITVAGSGLDSLDTFIGWLEELLGKARKMRTRGLELGTFTRILKDEAKA
jgi:ParB family chromosome partitioning protein